MNPAAPSSSGGKSVALFTTGKARSLRPGRKTEPTSVPDATQLAHEDPAGTKIPREMRLLTAPNQGYNLPTGAGPGTPIGNHENSNKEDESYGSTCYESIS